MSWRTIGYIPNFDSLFDSKNYSVQSKHNDFHFCLRYLLNGVEKLCSTNNSYDWEFEFSCYPERKYKRNLKFVLGNVLSDAKGANVLCSRYGNNTSTTHLARDCDVLICNADDPNHSCKFHKQKDIQQLNTEELSAISFRKAFPYNAFTSIDFGANIYGINGACAADPCHMFNKGVVERLPNIFMARLTPQMNKILDLHVGSMVSNYANQSDRDFPDIKIFSSGIKSCAKLRSDQHISRVLVIYLVLLTTEFERLIVNKKGRKQDTECDERTPITLNEYKAWIQIFEETLILHSWVYADEHPKEFFKGGKNSIVCDRLREFMNVYKKNALRKEGLGLKFLKFHQILHLWWIIRLFGSLYNVDTARCESHHKKKKTIGKQTQRRVELFDEQTSMGEYKYNLFVKAFEVANMSLPACFEKVTSTMKPQSSDITNNGSEYKLTFDYEKNQVTAEYVSPKMKHSSPSFPIHILDAVYQKFKGYNHGQVGKQIKSICGFTEFKIKKKGINNIIRACPEYRNDKHWFDWATFQWEDYGLLQGQCLLFLDFNTIEFTTNESQTMTSNEILNNIPHEKIANGIGVLVHSISSNAEINNQRPCEKKSETNVKEANIIHVRLVSFAEMENTYQLIDVDTLVNQAYVIPYKHRSKEETYLPGCTDKVIILKEQKCWIKYFIDYDDENLKEDGKSRIDVDIVESDERYPFEG